MAWENVRLESTVVEGDFVGYSREHPDGDVGGTASRVPCSSMSMGTIITTISLVRDSLLP